MGAVLIMRRIFLALALCLLAGQASAAIAFVNSGDITNNGGTTNTLSHSYTVTAGSSLLVLCITGDVVTGNDDLTTVTLGSQNFTLVKKWTNTPAGPTGSRFQYMYDLTNPTAGAGTITINSTNNHFILAVVGEYSGTATSSEVDNTGVNATTSSPVSTNITVNTANSWVIVSAQPSTVTPGATNLTQRLQTVTFFNPTLYDSNAALGTGSFTASFNATSSPGGAAAFASFKPAGAAAATPMRTLMGEGQ